MNRKIQEGIEANLGEANIKKRGNNEVFETKVALSIWRRYRRRGHMEAEAASGGKHTRNCDGEGGGAVLLEKTRKKNHARVGARFSVPMEWGRSGRENHVPTHPNVGPRRSIEFSPWRKPTWIVLGPWPGFGFPNRP